MKNKYAPSLSLIAENQKMVLTMTKAMKTRRKTIIMMMMMMMKTSMQAKGNMFTSEINACCKLISHFFEKYTLVYLFISWRTCKLDI